MKAKNPSGRPALNRNRVAGEHLRIALKMLGKKWRRDVEDARHVLSWANWVACDLPRSPTTIDMDIREGIPENRIAAYAHCLGILPELFISPQTDMVTLLADSLSADDTRTPTMPLSYREAFPGRFVEHNRQSYMQELFALMNGVYRMHYVLQGVELIHRCTVWVYDVEAYRLLLRGRFSMFGAENEFDGNMFRWHNNLHVHYLCQNEMELGYTMTVDPLRHNLVKRRNPFWLKGQGLTDRGLADNIPITFTYRMEMLPLPDGMTHEGLWLQECNDVLERPFFAPGASEYGALWAEVLSPDDLLA